MKKKMKKKKKKKRRWKRRWRRKKEEERRSFTEKYSGSKERKAWLVSAAPPMTTSSNGPQELHNGISFSAENRTSSGLHASFTLYIQYTKKESERWKQNIDKRGGNEKERHLYSAKTAYNVLFRVRKRVLKCCISSESQNPSTWPPLLLSNLRNFLLSPPKDSQAVLGLVRYALIQVRWKQ